MTTIFAIDPGPKRSAFVLYETNPGGRGKLQLFGMLDSPEIEALVVHHAERGVSLALEDIRGYGVKAGNEVFDTVRALSRFELLFEQKATSGTLKKFDRREVKSRVCGSSTANDALVRAALIDRWGGKEAALGSKKAPGPLYGLKEDAWSALAVAVAVELVELDEIRKQVAKA